MTYSICATDGTVHGIAIATKAPTVGSICPFLSRNGAVSSQSFTNTPLGVKAAALMDGEASVDDAVTTLLEKDEDAALRQVHGVDAWGNTVVFSGEDCIDWFGGREADGYTVAGNMLVGEEVLDAVDEAYEASDPAEPMGDRLLAALRAGEDAGGDKRAEHAQSAALKVHDPDEPGLHHDVRVDDHEDPVTELERVYKVTREDDQAFREEYEGSLLQRHP